MGRLLLGAVLVGCAYDPRAAELVGSDAPSGGRDAQADGPPADTAAITCPNGYTLRVEGSCHRTGGTATTWDLAEADCELAGAHLVVVDDTIENDALPDNVWIGLSERTTAGTFRWVTGTPFIFVLGWASGEPGSAGGASCVEARSDGWHDDNCPETKNYVCEFDGRPADPSQF